MERLNDIMMKTTQHHQEIQEQRSTRQGEGALSQRHKSQLTRRPSLPEQTARLGQQTSYAAPRPQAQPQQHNRHIQNNPPLGSGNRGEQVARYPQQSANGQTLRQREIDQRSPVYYQRSQRRVQEQEPQYFATRQKEAKTTSDYYDAYPTMPPADVQEDWEDDAEGMRYGDWEDEAIPNIDRYSPTDAEVTFAAPVVPQDTNWLTAQVLPHRQYSSPIAAREVPNKALQKAEPRSPLTRNLREARTSQAQPPAPQAPTQETQRYHRNTQPLNARAVVGMNQDFSQEETDVQQPTRQVVIHEQLQQHLPVFIPPPMAPKSVCSKCKGAGYLRIDVPFGHPNFGKPIPCECKEAERRERRREQLRSMSNLEAFRDKSFKTFNPRVPGVQEAYQVALEYAQNPDGWLLLLGPNGCGKTHLAAAIANQSLNDGALVLFAVVPDLFFDLRASFAPTALETHEQLFFRMREAELLVLDDLGAQKNSPWTAEKLFQLLNYRYNSGFPTVITANLQGLQGIDERIRSRLNDVCLVNRVRLDRVHDYRPNNTRRK